MLVQLEDVLGMRDQVNFPGTTSEHPNWRRKLQLAIDRWAEDPRFAELARTLDAQRRRTSFDAGGQQQIST